MLINYVLRGTFSGGLALTIVFNSWYFVNLYHFTKKGKLDSAAYYNKTVKSQHVLLLFKIDIKMFQSIVTLTNKLRLENAVFSV